MQYNPPSSCILEINMKGVKLLVQDDYYAYDRVRLPHTYTHTCAHTRTQDRYTDRLRFMHTHIHTQHMHLHHTHTLFKAHLQRMLERQQFSLDQSTTTKLCVWLARLDTKICFIQTSDQQDHTRGIFPVKKVYNAPVWALQCIAVHT